jgi:hypothetical protein
MVRRLARAGFRPFVVARRADRQMAQRPVSSWTTAAGRILRRAPDRWNTTPATARPVGRTRGGRRPGAYLLDLGDLDAAVAAGALHLDLVADLMPEQCLADGRLHGDPPLGDIDLRGSDDREQLFAELVFELDG